MMPAPTRAHTHTPTARIAHTTGSVQRTTAARCARQSQPEQEGPAGGFVPHCRPLPPRARSPHPLQAGLSAAGAAHVSPGDHTWCPAGNGGHRLDLGSPPSTSRNGRRPQGPVGLGRMGSGSTAAWPRPWPPARDRHTQSGPRWCRVGWTRPRRPHHVCALCLSLGGPDPLSPEPSPRPTSPHLATGHAARTRSRTYWQDGPMSHVSIQASSFPTSKPSRGLPS